MSLKEDLELFSELIESCRYDFHRLAYIIWPFGEPGTEWEHRAPYKWQITEWNKLSAHLMDPATRYETYRLIVSSGNGAAKTAFSSMTMIMLMYTQQLRARVTANTDPQLKQVVWPEFDKWFRDARFNTHFFEKLGTSIKAKNEKEADTWRIDTVTWSEQNPTAISGLHNEGRAVMYLFEEAPGIPASIWKYASGAFTEKNTIKIWFAMGNSDDPESKFEQNMLSPDWRALRIDTRDLEHIDQQQVQAWLNECGGNVDHDDFRVRVRGLPRKSAKDSIITIESIDLALGRRKKFDRSSVLILPCILTCDPAWTGGDETCIWYHQGNYSKMLEKYKLDKAAGQDHMFTYNRLVHWERVLKADAVFLDQAEGTAVYTLANNAGKNWELVSFGSAANDTAEFKDSQYSNMRALMYYEGAKFLAKEGVLDAENEEWIEDIRRQLAWTKGTRHKIHGKKLAEPKLDIKKRVGQSPDVADGWVLRFARPVTERLPENDPYVTDDRTTGGGAWKMPAHEVDYESRVSDGLYD